MKINQYPLTATQINDQDYYDVDYWNGTAFETRKISGATLKAQLLTTDATLVTSDITTNDVSTLKHGFVPKAPNDTTKYLRGDGTWATVSAGVQSIPQEDVIYIDSVNGVDDTTTSRGQIWKPFASVEYVLANTTNTGTVTGNTTNGNNTITSVSSTTNIKVGQYITGSNIPYNTIVIAKTSNTIVLSQNAIGSGTGSTITWWTIKTLKIVNDILATSNWFKAGFWFDCGDSNITWGNFRLFVKTTACLVPEVITGGNWFGNHASSQFLYSNNVTSLHDVYIDINSFFSIGTGYQIQEMGAVFASKFHLNCKNFNANLGYISYLMAQNYVQINGNYYGLLGGFELGKINNTARYYLNANVETPASINAVDVGFYQTTPIYINGRISGQLKTNGSLIFDGSASGTTHSITCTEYAPFRTVINGDLFGNVTYSGDPIRSVIFNGNTAIGGAFTNTNGYVIIQALYGDYTGTSASIGYISQGGTYGVSTFFRNVTLSGTSRLTVKNNQKALSYITYGQIPVLTIGSGCTFIVEEYTYGQLINSGTVIIEGTLDHEANGSIPNQTGTLIVNGTLNLVRKNAENSTNSPTYSISTGTVIVNSGTIQCAHTDSQSGLIRKTASGGKLILRGQSYLKVANGLAPLQILSNTGTARDIMDFSMLGNGAVGFRLSDTFSDTTYGTAYAPNLLVNGTRYEDSTYNF